MTSVSNAIIDGLAERKAGKGDDNKEPKEKKSVRKRDTAVTAKASSEEE